MSRQYKFITREAGVAKVAIARGNKDAAKMVDEYKKTKSENKN
jgi:hypothetical protein